ncbi:hypothetical protein HDU77_011163 [Chytriomyces hyalinus]|nr:hypothetical protein HDU77_011163 [Chytriomyces hyalinus]
MAEEADTPTKKNMGDASPSSTAAEENRLDSTERLIPVTLFVGKNKQVSASVSADDVLTLRHSTTGQTLFAAPLPLVALKVLNLGVSSPGQGKVLNLFRRRESNPASDTVPNPGSNKGGLWAGYRRSSLAPSKERVHFQLLSPCLTHPLFLFTLTMDDFNLLRSHLDDMRLAALAGNSAINCCSAADMGVSGVEYSDLDASYMPSEEPPVDATGHSLLQWLQSKDSSNRVCGGCGCENPPPSWAAVYKPSNSSAIALIVCDNCSGYYRGVVDFSVRSFLLDVSVFEDKSNYIYAAIASTLNHASCVALARIASESSSAPQFRLYFTEGQDSTLNSPTTNHLRVPGSTTPLQPRRASDQALDYTFMSHHLNSNNITPSATSKSNSKLSTSPIPQKKSPLNALPLSPRASKSGPGFSMNLSKTQTILSRMMLHRSSSGSVPSTGVVSAESGRDSRPSSPCGSLNTGAGDQSIGMRVLSAGNSPTGAPTSDSYRNESPSNRSNNAVGFRNGFLRRRASFSSVVQEKSKFGRGLDETPSRNQSQKGWSSSMKGSSAAAGTGSEVDGIKKKEYRVQTRMQIAMLGNPF